MGRRVLSTSREVLAHCNLTFVFIGKRLPGLAIDPDFAPAYAAISYEYTVRGTELDRNNDLAREKAFVATQKCLALDPDDAACYTARAVSIWRYENHFPNAAAVADLKHAIALNPNSDEAHQQLANIYNHIGILDKARSEFLKAEALNPVNPATRFGIGVNLLYAGRYEDALMAIRGSRRFLPSLWAYQTSFSMYQLGRREEAAAFLRGSPRRRPLLACGLGLGAGSAASAVGTIAAVHELHRAAPSASAAPLSPVPPPPLPPVEVTAAHHRHLLSFTINPLRGLASWYGSVWNGRTTASGEAYDDTKMTAAHKSLPLAHWCALPIFPHSGR